jgi:hypothetical protein
MCKISGIFGKDLLSLLQPVVCVLRAINFSDGMIPNLSFLLWLYHRRFLHRRQIAKLSGSNVMLAIRFA